MVTPWPLSTTLRQISRFNDRISPDEWLHTKLHNRVTTSKVVTILLQPFFGVECFDFKQNFKPSFSGFSCYLFFYLLYVLLFFFFKWKLSSISVLFLQKKKSPFFSYHEASFSRCCPYCQYFLSELQYIILHLRLHRCFLFVCGAALVSRISYSSFPSLWWSLKRHFLMCLLPRLSPKITAKFVTDFLSVSLPYILQYSSLKIRRHFVFFSSFSVLGSPFPLENKPNKNEGF